MTRPNIYVVVPILNYCESEFQKFISAHIKILEHYDIKLLIKTTTPTKVITQKNIYFHSQEDSSIYQAWNQSIDVITRIERDADFYVTFCGIDDLLNLQFIALAHEQLSLKFDIIFGDIEINVGKRLISKRANMHSSMLQVSNSKCWDIFHPGMIMHSQLFKQIRFDESLRLAADFKFFVEAGNQMSLKTKYIPNSQAIINLDGISNQSNARRTYLYEMRKIESELGIKVLGFSKLIEQLKLLLLTSVFGPYLRKLYWKFR